MENLFEVKVRYEKIDEQSGREKKVTEKFIFDAVSFTEAESRIHKEMEMMIRGEFIVTAISRAKISEIIPTDGDIWYKGKVKFIALDEQAGREKKVTNIVLVLANSVDDAYNEINKAFQEMVVDYTIEGIVDSKIMDFFPYSDNDTTETQEGPKE